MPNLQIKYNVKAPLQMCVKEGTPQVNPRAMESSGLCAPPVRFAWNLINKHFPLTK